MCIISSKRGRFTPLLTLYIPPKLQKSHFLPNQKCVDVSDYILIVTVASRATCEALALEKCVRMTGRTFHGIFAQIMAVDVSTFNTIVHFVAGCTPVHFLQHLLACLQKPHWCS